MAEQNAEVQNTLAAFRDVTRELDNTYAVFPKSCGLSEVEYYSLLLIYEGVTTQTQISEQMYLSRSTLNSAFKQLRKRGLIHLEPYDENQRSKQTFLTDAGKEFVEKNVLQMHRIEERAWRRMSEEEHETLIGLIQKVNSLIQQELKNMESGTD
ncbi:MAG: MarR family transcriptional regulator [Lachnospiraceae bacterium]|nr:MarR family transcriptional regulator [Lachnospiraceae bacterium]